MRPMTHLGLLVLKILNARRRCLQCINETTCRFVFSWLLQIVCICVTTWSRYLRVRTNSTVCGSSPISLSSAASNASRAPSVVVQAYCCRLLYCRLCWLSTVYRHTDLQLIRFSALKIDTDLSGYSHVDIMTCSQISQVFRFWFFVSFNKSVNYSLSRYFFCSN